MTLHSTDPVLYFLCYLRDNEESDHVVEIHTTCYLHTWACSTYIKFSEASDEYYRIKKISRAEAETFAEFTGLPMYSITDVNIRGFD